MSFPISAQSADSAVPALLAGGNYLTKMQNVCPAGSASAYSGSKPGLVCAVQPQLGAERDGPVSLPVQRRAIRNGHVQMELLRHVLPRPGGAGQLVDLLECQLADPVLAVKEMAGWHTNGRVRCSRACAGLPLGVTAASSARPLIATGGSRSSARWHSVPVGFRGWSVGAAPRGASATALLCADRFPPQQEIAPEDQPPDTGAGQECGRLLPDLACGQ